MLEKIQNAKAQQLTELNLSSCGLRELPEELAELTHLKKLNLSNNQLESLPDWLGKLTELETLFLYSNQLTEVPAALAACCEIKWIDFGNNPLGGKVPEVLRSFAKLEKLKLYGLGLTEIPDWVWELEAVTEADLSNNQLTAVPAGILNLKKLEYLTLSDNPFTEIPASLSALTQLKSLELENLQLRALPAEFSAFKEFFSINLQGNQFTELPAFVTGSRGLQMLWLGENQISELPEAMGTLSELNWLSIAGNPIAVLPDGMQKLSKLETIMLGQTPVDDQFGGAGILMGQAEITRFLKQACHSAQSRIQLPEVYALLESRDAAKIATGMQHLEAHPEYKLAAEKRYLKFIQVRLEKPSATLADLGEASLSTTEEAKLLSKHFSQDFISLSYFDGAECRLVVDFLGAMVAKHLDIDAHVKAMAGISDIVHFRKQLKNVEGRVRNAIARDAAEYREGWFGKVLTRMQAMSLEKVMFENTHFSEANQSPVLREYMFFLSAFTRIETNLYLDIFQSDTPELTEMFWMMLRVPKTAWGDVEPQIPPSKLQFDRVAKVRSGDFGKWKNVKSVPASNEPEVDPAGLAACALLEKVLQEKYGLQADAYQEGDSWYRFQIEDCRFQAGLKPMEGESDDCLYFVIHLDEIDPEYDLDKVLREARKASRKASGELPQSFGLQYLDGYFAFENYMLLKSRFRGPITEAAIAENIENMMAFAEHPSVQVVNGEYRLW